MITRIEILNYKLFPSDQVFEIDALNTPDGESEGSGLNIFVGENGCGKSTLLDAFALPYISFKADSFSVNDMNDPNVDTEIMIFTNDDFTYKGTMPKQEYKGRGFYFKGGRRKVGSKSFASSTIVTDQQFIRADGTDKPKDNSPELRLSVNNPWAGSRYNELEYLILDKNRTFQTRKGTYNDTRFDKIMEDFNFQYLKKTEHPLDCNEELKGVKSFNKGIAESVATAIKRFSEISGQNLKLQIIDNWKPFSNAFFGIEKENHQSVSLDQLGSGYEMIFSLLYAYYLSKKEKKKLVVLIDEPELHLHPRLQQDFIHLLLEFSKDSQIILTTHSPLFVKQAMINENVNVKVLLQKDGIVEVANPQLSVLPYVSSNEVNFVAFSLPTEEYHNELYEFIKDTKAPDKGIKQFDLAYFQREMGENNSYPWMGSPNQVSIHTFLRNQIHHRADNGAPNFDELSESIEKMRGFIIEDQKKDTK